MAKKYVRGYTIEDIKVGMKIHEKEDKDNYYIIKSVDDIHNVHAVIYRIEDNKKVGNAYYCLDKKCEFEYFGGKIEIVE